MKSSINKFTSEPKKSHRMVAKRILKVPKRNYNTWLAIWNAVKKKKTRLIVNSSSDKNHAVKKKKARLIVNSNSDKNHFRSNSIVIKLILLKSSLFKIALDRYLTKTYTWFFKATRERTCILPPFFFINNFYFLNLLNNWFFQSIRELVPFYL